MVKVRRKRNQAAGGVVGVEGGVVGGVGVVGGLPMTGWW